MARLLPFLNIDTVLMFFLSRAYGYVKHIRNIQSTGCVHMFSIGRCVAYVWHMYGICMAVAYVDARHMFSISLFLSFLSEIRKKVVTDLPLPPHSVTSRQHSM
ncbi:hypothetical protein FWY30_24955 [Escherichia coli]|nr:hypothetical protein [Escherichia coli]